MSAIKVNASGNLVVSVRLTLRPGRDDALIDLVQSAPRGKLAALIREAMRSGVGQSTAYDSEDDFELPEIGLEL